jgi:hypothetical protein
VAEITDLVAVLAAVDREVGAVDGDERRVDVTRQVPGLEDGTRFGWSESIRRRAQSQDAELPTVEQAMANLAAEPTRFASMTARRLVAVALAAQVFPEQFAPGGEREDVALTILAAPGILAELPDLTTPPPDQPPETPGLHDEAVAERARALLEVLADPARAPQLGAWDGFKNLNAGLVNARMPGLRACSAGVIELSDEEGRTTALETRHCVTGVAFDAVAGKLLNQEAWPACSPWWCSVKPADDGRFLEVVSAGCPIDPSRPNPVLEVAVFLDFATAVNRPGDSRVLVYRMSEGPGGQEGQVDGQGANHAVDIDEGSIEVRKVSDPEHVHVYTTKRVRFLSPLDPEALAVLACWVGYGDAASDLIVNCVGAQAVEIGCPPAQHAPLAADGQLTRAVDHVAGVAHECVTVAADEARRVAERLDHGVYTPDTATADLSRLVALTVRGWAKVATLPLDVARLSTPPSAPESGRFRFVPPVNQASSLRSGDLKSPFGDVIARHRVAVLPAELGANEDTFNLVVSDPAGLHGSTYTGTVIAERPAAAGLAAELHAGPVDVYIIVP